jgi:hypothetical protein
VPALRSIVVFLAQIVGGIAAAAVVDGLLPGSLTVGVSLGGGTSIVRGLFIEMFTTCQLTFAVIMLAAVKHKATYLAPLGIGLALFAGHLFSTSVFPVISTTRLTTERYLLHGSRHQPSSSLWSCGGDRHFSGLPLDLLARALAGRPRVSWVLSRSAFSSLGAMQPWTGLR